MSPPQYNMSHITVTRDKVTRDKVTCDKVTSENVTQYSDIPFEIFTLDDVFTSKEIEEFSRFVENADEKNRHFSSSPFKNGKIVHEQYSNIMWTKIKESLPATYKDRKGVTWVPIGVPYTIMYATIQANQRFGIHTDTGCVYDTKENMYSKFTVLTYLNDNFEGGQTTFYDTNFTKTVSISPRKNRTLIFDIDLYHCGEVVITGKKNWIGTELVAGMYR